MSTLLGHSLRQPLQAKHESSTACTSALVTPLGSVVSFSRSTLARARVVFNSSALTLKAGHIVPPMRLDLRQSPAPLQRSIWLTMDGARCTVGACARRYSSIGGVRTILPTLRRPSGSKASLSWQKRSYTSCPYISGMNSPRNRPSPCSPDRLPLCLRTSWAVSVATSRNLRLSSGCLRSKIGRRCSSPVDICP